MRLPISRAKISFFSNDDGEAIRRRQPDGIQARGGARLPLSSHLWSSGGLGTKSWDGCSAFHPSLRKVETYMPPAVCV